MPKNKIATKNSSAPKWGAKCLELMREMNFPVVTATTINTPLKSLGNLFSKYTTTFY